jgi:peptidoglycan L-alanyl-D-glutamate endopeptidase CwlK
MMFELSPRSLKNLEGVDQRLVDIVHRAIQITTIDFAVIEGLRTPEKQLEYYKKGASQIAVGGTHVQGRAVDLMAYLDGRASWEIALYDNIADAMRVAAVYFDVGLRWGAAWHINDIRDWNGTMEQAMNAYVDLRRSQGQRPFIDGPHFELID